MPSITGSGRIDTESNTVDSVATGCHMTAHSLSEKGWRRGHHRTRKELVQLRWFHFWLLIGILGGLLGLIGVGFFAHLSSL